VALRASPPQHVRRTSPGELSVPHIHPGKGSIDIEVLKGFFSGIAHVVTTSRYSHATVEYYQGIFFSVSAPVVCSYCRSLGTVLRLTLPGEVRTYMAVPQFPKHADAVNAECLAALEVKISPRDKDAFL
jgi:hypothetical protein